MPIALGDCTIAPRDSTIAPGDCHSTTKLNHCTMRLHHCTSRLHRCNRRLLLHEEIAPLHQEIAIAPGDCNIAPWDCIIAPWDCHSTRKLHQEIAPVHQEIAKILTQPFGVLGTVKKIDRPFDSPWWQDSTPSTYTWKPLLWPLHHEGYYRWLFVFYSTQFFSCTQNRPKICRGPAPEFDLHNLDLRAFALSKSPWGLSPI